MLLAEVVALFVLLYCLRVEVILVFLWGVLLGLFCWIGVYGLHCHHYWCCFYCQLFLIMKVVALLLFLCFFGVFWGVLLGLFLGWEFTISASGIVHVVFCHELWC